MGNQEKKPNADWFTELTGDPKNIREWDKEHWKKQFDADAWADLTGEPRYTVPKGQESLPEDVPEWFLLPPKTLPPDYVNPGDTRRSATPEDLKEWDTLIGETSVDTSPKWRRWPFKKFRK